MFLCRSSKSVSTNGDINGTHDQCGEEWLPDTVAYTFHIRTGFVYPQLGATRKWDDGTMVLVVNPGSKDAESQELRVNRTFHTDTEWATIADFWLPEHIGEPKLLKIRLESHRFEVIKEELYVKEISVRYNRKSYRFPIRNYLYPYHPSRKNSNITDSRCPPYLLAQSGPGSIKHLTTEDYLVKAREHELNTVRRMVPWANQPTEEETSNGLELLTPNFTSLGYDELPRFLQFKDASGDAFQSLRKVGRKKMAKSVLESQMVSLFGNGEEDSRLDSYEAFKKHLIAGGSDWNKEDMEQIMKVADRIHCDAEFGRQMMCGNNSIYLTKVAILHERWMGAVDNVPDHVFNGNSITDVVSSGKLFEVSAGCLLDNVPHGGKSNKLLAGFDLTWFVAPSDCLLWVNDKGDLVPAVIRIENKVDGEEASFWYPPPEDTPTDHSDALSWALAKMYFRCSDSQIYALMTHFCRAHAVNEVFAVASHRNLPSSHPVLRLLHPHIQGIIAVNAQARDLLVNPKSMFLSAGDHLPIAFDNFYRHEFKYQRLIVPEDLKSRGVDDMGGAYLFADDSLALWNAILRYTSEVVELSYPSNDDVAKDRELQNWVLEMVDVGFAGFDDGAGFPRQLRDRASLSELVTVIIFNISVFHAAVNFQCITALGFYPNCPGVMIKSPPCQDEIITEDRLWDSIAPKQIAFVQAHLANMLGSLSPVEKFYLPTVERNRGGLRDEVNMVCHEQLACVDRLTATLREIQNTISERNQGREIIFDVMNPTNVPLTTQA